MASREEKLERAEEAARESATELSDINRERRERDYEEEEGPATMESDRDYYKRGQEERPGVIGTILKSVAKTLESAREAVIGKSYDEPREGSYEEAEEERGITDRPAEKGGETKEAVKEKAATAKEKAKETAESAAEKAQQAKETVKEKGKETTESAAEKARQAKEAVKGKTEEYKDYAAEKANEAKEKARETKDSAAEKAKEGKDRVAEKGGEYKDYTKEKGGEYKDYTKEKAEETKERAKEAEESGVVKISKTARKAMELLSGGKREDERGEEPKEKYMESEDEARRKMQELKLREEGYDDEGRKRAEAERETAEDRGIAGTRNIFSAIGSVKEAIKEKLTMPSDIVEETQAAREHGGTKRVAEEKEVVDSQGNPVDKAGRVRLQRGK